MIHKITWNLDLVYNHLKCLKFCDNTTDLDALGVVIVLIYMTGKTWQTMHLIKVVLSQAITKTSNSWMDEERKTEVLDWLDWHEEEVVHLQNIWNEQIPNLIVLTSLTCNITINKMIRMK